MKNASKTLQKHQNVTQRLKRESSSAVKPGLQADLQHVLENPDSTTPANLLCMQAKVGNAVVSRWLSSNGLVQREALTDSGGYLQSGLSGAIQRARGSGSPLPEAIRREMEGKFSTNLEAVRVHTGQQADQLSQQLSARAFTIGSDIFFKREAYAPGTTRGRRTLQHELTHVLQQGGQAPRGRLRLGEPGTAEERQAERSANNLSSGLVGPSATVQREIDYDGIAASFGGSVTAEMVKKWTDRVKPKNHPVVEQILLKGKTIEEFQRGMLQVYGVDLAAMDADLGVRPAQTDQKPSPPPPTGQSPTPNNAPQPPSSSGAPPARTTALPRLPGEAGLTNEDIEAYVMQRAGEEHMPSGALLDALRDTCSGDLKRLSPVDVDQIITLFKNRDFDGLAKKGISINHIVAFTGGFERLGVGDTKDPNKGITGAVKSAFLGNDERWAEGRAAGAADFMQNSMFWTGLSGMGALSSNLSMLNMFSSQDNPLLGAGAVNGTELAGNIMANTASVIQASGSLVRSGVDFANVHAARGFNSSIRGQAVRQQASEGAMNMFYGLSGLSSSGLGFGLGAQNFAAGGMKNNTDGTLGVAKSALEAGTSAVSLGTRIEKSAAAVYRGREMSGITYRPSSFLSIQGRSKEEAVFPKLKAVLQDAQSKKAKGQGLDMGKDAAKTTGGVLSSVGFGVGGDVGKYLKLAGTLTGVAGSLASPLISKIKGLVQDKKVEKSGYRNLQEYRMDRMRSLQSTDESGQSSSINVRVGQVVDDVNGVYEDFHQTNTNKSPADLEGPVAQLSVSRLLSHTGEYMRLNTIFSSKNLAERREAIKNVLLSRKATF